MRCKPVVVVVLLALLAPQARAWTRELRIPLRDGRLHLADLTEDCVRVLRLDRILDPSRLDASVSLRGLGGALWVQAMNAAIGEGCSLSVNDDALIVRMDSSGLPGSWPAAKAAIREFTAVAAPQATAAQQRYYGLLLPEPYDPALPLVILIHGLDCNRSTWEPMADALADAGHQVAYFTYPSDQALSDSAALLAGHITALRTAHPQATTHLVAHSMGCLVAREYVEGPDYDGGVGRLILIGPPNHGSGWARLRFTLEIEEHYRLWREEPDWRWTWIITDGLGEAGADLRPNSPFMQQLNARPRREGVHYTILAGTQHAAAAVAGAWLGYSAELMPQRSRGWWGLRQVHGTLDDWGRRLLTRAYTSDGPVTLASAALEGVSDMVILPADHAGLYMPTGPRAPPAWQVVIERLSSQPAEPDLAALR